MTEVGRREPRRRRRVGRRSPAHLLAASVAHFSIYLSIYLSIWVLLWDCDWHWLGLWPPCDILVGISARAGLQSAGTGLSRSPAPRKRNATAQTIYTALRRGSCCTLCSRLRPQLRRWKAASEAPQRGRGHRWRFCYSQLELAALCKKSEERAQKNDILTGRVSPKLALDTTKEGGS